MPRTRGASAPGHRSLLANSSPIQVIAATSFREHDGPTLVDWACDVEAAERARREFNLVRLNKVGGDYEIVHHTWRSHA